MSYVPSGTGRVFIVDADGIRYKVRIQTRAGFQPAEAPVETRRSLDRDEGERTSVGSPGHGTYSLDFEPNPLLSSNRMFKRFHRNGGLCTIEEDRGGTPTVLEVGDGTAKTAQISAMGILTLGGSNASTLGTEARPTAPWTQGLGVIIQNVLYIVDEITDTDKARVNRWGAVVPDPRFPSETGRRYAPEDEEDIAAVSAAAYQLVQPGVRSSQAGRVSQGGGDEASGAGETTAAGVLQLSSERRLAALLPAA